MLSKGIFPPSKLKTHEKKSTTNEPPKPSWFTFHGLLQMLYHLTELNGKSLSSVLMKFLKGTTNRSWLCLQTMSSILKDCDRFKNVTKFASQYLNTSIQKVGHVPKCFTLLFLTSLRTRNRTCRLKKEYPTKLLEEKHLFFLNKTQCMLNVEKIADLKPGWKPHKPKRL